jgi:dephospho-CoA kinase
MSGVGKSSVLAALEAQGHRVIDIDHGWVTPLPDGRQRWDLERLGRALEEPRSAPLFVAGCDDDLVALLPQVDVVVVLTVPVDVALERVAERVTNPFGHSEADRIRIAADFSQFEPRLLEVADVVVDATRPLPAVVTAVLDAAGTTWPRL